MVKFCINENIFSSVNIRKFQNPREFPVRYGSEKDAKKLEALFSQIGFKIFEKKALEDLNSWTFKTKLAEFSALKDHGDIMILVVMSHGDTGVGGGVIFTADGEKFDIENIISFFNNQNDNLRGKPKLFVFQSCLGDRLPLGIQTGKLNGIIQLPNYRTNPFYRCKPISRGYPWISCSWCSCDQRIPEDSRTDRHVDCSLNCPWMCFPETSSRRVLVHTGSLQGEKILKFAHLISNKCAKTKVVFKILHLQRCSWREATIHMLRRC